jgi:hypothetical protein
MLLLVTKGLLAPALMAMCTLAGRRWGTLVGGWLLGLPLISGPVSYFLFVQHGSGFAGDAARGALLGMVGTGVFFVVYAALAKRRAWWRTLPVASVTAVAVTVALTQAHLGLVVAILVAVGFLALVTTVVGGPRDDVRLPASKLHTLFVRMASASAMVVGVTLASTQLGPQLSGMLTAVPIISAMMAVSTHRAAGGASVLSLVRGAVAGLWGGAAFFAVVASLITGPAPVLTYLAATLAAAAAAGMCGALMARARTERSSRPGYAA